MNLKSILFMLMVAITMSSCNNQEFSIEGEIKNAGTMNIRAFYYSSAKDKGKIVETAIPVVNDKFTYTGWSERPTVVWLMSPNRELLTPVYIEPGDELTLSGEYGKPLEWQLAGNDIEQQWCQWRKKNAKALESGNDRVINDAIAKYVKANRDNPISALSMLCFFVKRDNIQDYDKLWKSLSENARPQDIVNAVDAMKNHTYSQAYKHKITSLSLYSYADSMETINPTKSHATLLYFWRQQEEQHDSCIANIKRLEKLYKDSILLIADINMDTDTIKWRRQARKDSVKNWQRYWAIGAEMNLSLNRLEIGRTPYLIVVDSTGSQRYRGESFSKAEAKIKEMLKKK